MNKQLLSRANELTTVHNRERFDAPPGDISNPIDLERWRQFRIAYHKAQRLESIASFPLQIDFELNSTCNMTCGFCVHGQERVPKQTLPFELFAKAIEEGQQHGLCSIKMNYINEPLLNRELPEYIAFAKSRGVLNVYFATNGSVMNERMCRRLIDAKVSKVMISLDATTPETFAIMRNGTERMFQRITDNIYTLLRIRNERELSYPLVRVNFLKTHLNIHEADAFIKQWTGTADMLGLQDQVGLPGVESDWLVESKSLRVTFDDFRCSFPFKLMVVDANGDLLPCCTFSGREMPQGNIRTTTIEEAWNSQSVVELREMHQRGRYKDNSVCAHCIGDYE